MGAFSVDVTNALIRQQHAIVLAAAWSEENGNNYFFYIEFNLRENIVRYFANISEMEDKI